MAALMGPSRSQLDRALDPESDVVTLKSLIGTARLVGKKIKIDLLDAA
jgi:antitoxin HicB